MRVYLSRRKKRKENTTIDTLTPILPEHLRTLLAQAHARGETSITRARAAFSFGDYSRMPLAYCGFPESYWTGARLEETDFRFADLTSSTFLKCNLSHTKLFGSGYMGTTFQGGDLSGLFASGCSFDYATFISLVASRAEFAGSSLCETTWRDCVLVGASFREADLTGATFIEQCTLPCIFTRAILSDVVFEDCDLYEADLSWANCTGAAFRGSSLRGANLYGAILEDAFFESVEQLQSTSLRGIADACEHLFTHLGDQDCCHLRNVLHRKQQGEHPAVGLTEMFLYPLVREEDEDQEGDSEDTRIRKAFRRDITQVALHFCRGIVQQREHPEGNPVAQILLGWLDTFLK